MSNNNLKKILVTGGAGFIGSHLCSRLVEDNYVFCLDNFYTGREENISHLINNPNFELIRADVVDSIDIRVDEIYNFACPASPPHYQKDPIKTATTSVLGILNMLELARKNNAKILQASTSEVYGDPVVHPQNENYWGNVNPIGIRSCYDEGKRMAETLLMDYYRKFDLNIRLIRIFNTYGPNMREDDGRVVSNFICQALNGKNITIYGDGSQTRSFCYIDDLVNGIEKMMNNPSNFIGPVNLGNPSERTILDFAKIILSLVPTNSKIVYRDLPQDDPRQRKPDIALAMEKLNWSPEVDIETGIKKTIEYFIGRVERIK